MADRITKRAPRGAEKTRTEASHMLGAIVGDFVGSVHEFNAPKHKDFPLIAPGCTVTDDSLLTLAVAEWLMHGAGSRTRFAERFSTMVSAAKNRMPTGLSRRDDH